MYHTYLYVDDDTDDQEIFQMALERVDPSAICIVANQGLEALERLKSGLLPDVIFLDMNMHLMDGMECLREIKNIPQFVDTHIIMISAQLPAYIVERCLHLGADRCVVKSGNLTEMVDMIKEIQ